MRRVLRWGRWLIWAVLLTSLLAVGYGQWWLLPRLNHHRMALAAALSAYLQVPAQIEAVSAVYEGGWLRVRLDGVRLQDPLDQTVLARFGQATVRFEVWRSLREGRPHFSAVRLEGVSLVLEQGADGVPRLATGLGADSSLTRTDLAAALRWLFGSGRLDLAGDRLELRLRSGAVLSILHPYVQVRETATGWRLALSADLAQALGGRLHLVIDRNRPSVTGEETGVFSAQAALQPTGGLGPLHLADGQLAVEVRGAWRDWQPIAIEAQARLTELALAQPRRLTLLQRWLTAHPTADLALRGARVEGDAWQWHGQVDLPTGANRRAVSPGFEWRQHGDRMAGRAWDVAVQDLVAWGSPWLDEATQRRLAALEPQGVLTELKLDTAPEQGGYAVTGAFQHLAWRSAQGWPGCRAVAGTLAWNAAGAGQVTVRGEHLRIEADTLLPAPIPLDRLAGTVQWRETAEGLRLETTELALANPDFKAELGGHILIPAVGTPVLDLQGRYHEVKVSAARRYLPATLIPADGIAWLNQALVGGRVTAGDWVLRGPVAAFPFDRGEGVFETRFHVEDGILDYRPGWPRLEALNAQVTFRNRGLSIQATAGRLGEATLAQATARIDDLDQVRVQINGRVQGQAAALWHALHTSPLRAQLGEAWPELRWQGNSALDLALDIPTDAQPVRVQGQVHLAKNHLSLPAWKVALEQLQGTVRFTETGLEASALQGRWRDEPVQLTLKLAASASQPVLQVGLQGRSSLAALVGAAQAKGLAPYLTGRSRWQAELRAPLSSLRPGGNSAVPLQVHLHTDLRGMAVHLPPPLGKRAAETRPLAIRLQPLPADRLRADISYGTTTRAALELQEVMSHPRLARGELRINAGPAQLPAESGLSIVADLPRWDWQATGPLTVPDLIRSDLRHLQARIGQWVLGGHAINAVTVQATRDSEAWRIDLDGEEVAGRVTVPDQPKRQQPVNIALERLTLHPLANAPPTTPNLDPRRLPPLVLTVAQLRRDTLDLGRLRLVAMPRPSGVQLEALSLETELHRLDATGDWHWKAGESTSHLHAVLHSPALGETLATLGYVETGITGGATEAELRADWAGGWPDFALERLMGELRIKVGRGQLLAVEPGMGRMVGLLNLQTLLRRFTLDFNDLIQPGLHFDQISGQIALARDQAHSQNLVLEGPAVRIQAEGGIDLRQQTYDQRLTVTPKLNGALPVAGVIAGGPVGGAAALVAERLLQKGIQNLTGHEYRLRGSWQAPILERWHPETAAVGGQATLSDNRTR